MGFDAALIVGEELAADAAVTEGVGALTAAEVAAGEVSTGATAFGTGAALDTGVAAGAGAGTFAGAGGAALDAGTAVGTGVGAGTGVANGALIDSSLGTPGFGASSAGAGGIPDLTGTAIQGGSGASFLPVTGTGPGVSSMSPELQQSLGVVNDTGAGVGDLSGGAPSAVDAGTPTVAPDGTAPAYSGPGTEGAGAAGEGAPSALSQFGDVASGALKSLGLSPAQAGLLGISGVQALSKPKLPGAANTALNASSAAVQQAQGILASGGTSSPGWAGQKAAIDSAIDEQLRNATEQLIQSAQNSGQGGRDSAVVQQRINQLQTQANNAKQQRYSQALSQIVSAAVSELSGGNATLGSIAQMQMSQDEQARAAAAQTAELALLLGKGGG